MAIPPTDGIDVGQVLQGKYRVEAILGHGGMGVVVACTHLGLNERKALKVLRRDVLQDHDAVQRFLREAQAAGRLKSEYVAHVSDVGTFDDGLPYMVMDFLDGHDIGALLEERGKLPVGWATELVLQTAEALCEAHSIGIVHRDVKPTNLFVTWRPDGSALVKVLDFGISKSSVGTDMKLTQTQSVLGTPAYMSPEQMRSAHMVDSRSDIWSLGTVLYEMIEGHRPFEADSFSEMCVKVAVDQPQPMVVAPPPLRPVILRCLEKDPDKRFPTMADFGRALVPFAQNPQQAAHLVERMERMLRRSQILWEGDPSTSMQSLRMSAVSVDVGAGASGNTAGQRVATPLPRATGSAILAVPKRRAWTWIAAIAVFALGAAGGGLALALAGGEESPWLPDEFVAEVYRMQPPRPTLLTTPTPVPPGPTQIVTPVSPPQPQPPVVTDPGPTVTTNEPPNKHKPPHGVRSLGIQTSSPLAAPQGSAANLPKDDPFRDQHEKNQ